MTGEGGDTEPGGAGSASAPSVAPRAAAAAPTSSGRLGDPPPGASETRRADTPTRSTHPSPAGSGDGAAPRWVLGVDSGGSGVRVGLAVAQSRDNSPDLAVSLRGQRLVASPAATGGSGISAQSLLASLLPAAQELLQAADVPSVEAVVVGAAGMATLGDDLRANLPDALAQTMGARVVGLAADAVTGYAGALGDRPGAVVAAGTGLIALGTDLVNGWHRVDGWGHLLGDCGSGAWVGRAGLEAAFRAFDGRRGGSMALLSAMEKSFGTALGVPALLYPRPDRPAVLASFAPEVARCAVAGDDVALDIIAQAAGHIADAAMAACPRSSDPVVSCTGGLFGMGELLLSRVVEAVARERPDIRLVPSEGDPLLGSLRIAAALAGGGLRLPEEPPLLAVFDRAVR